MAVHVRVEGRRDPGQVGPPSPGRHRPLRGHHPRLLERQGGQRAAAETPLDRDADLNWAGWGGLTPLDVARNGESDAVVEWLLSLGAATAEEVG